MPDQAKLDKIAPSLNQRPRKTWVLRLPQVDCERVLHRPIETAPFIGMWDLPDSQLPTITIIETCPIHDAVGRIPSLDMDSNFRGVRYRIMVKASQCMCPRTESIIASGGVYGF